MALVSFYYHGIRLQQYFSQLFLKTDTYMTSTIHQPLCFTILFFISSLTGLFFRTKLGSNFKKFNNRPPVKIVEQLNGVLTSYCNHITITTKLQNNYYSELPEIQLNGSSITKDIKKRLVRGPEMQNGLVPYLHVVVKNQEGQLCYTGPP